MELRTDFVSVGLDLAEQFVQQLGPQGLVQIPMCIGKRRKDWARLEPRGDCPWCGSQCNGFCCGTHEKGCFYVGHKTDHLQDYWCFNAECTLFHG